MLRIREIVFRKIKQSRLFDRKKSLLTTIFETTDNMNGNNCYVCRNFLPNVSMNYHFNLRKSPTVLVEMTLNGATLFSVMSVSVCLKQPRDPTWHWNSGQTSSTAQNRSTRMTDIFKNLGNPGVNYLDLSKKTRLTKLGQFQPLGAKIMVSSEFEVRVTFKLLKLVL